MTTGVNIANFQEETIDRSREELGIKQEETFQWTKQWYPVAVVEFLDTSRPHKIQLLGKELVLWRDGSGKWACFEDFCPHRLAPLSEGRVESDGTLWCSYHAWRFDAQGNCVGIPQSKDKQTEIKHSSNSKSCAVAYPTQVCQGLIWVWAESGLQAQQESQLRKPRLIPELESDSDRVVKFLWNIRDFPYGWDFFIENVIDPAHVSISHHGIVGSRYKDANYCNLSNIRPMSTQEGFSFAVTPVEETVVEKVHEFQPPCYTTMTVKYKDGGKLILPMYTVPTRPGWCRYIGCQVLVRNEAGKNPKGLSSFPLLMPTWFGHIMTSLFLHQDLVLLHYQEKNLARQQHQDWLDAVYTPNPQDKMVTTFRQWFKNRAGGNIPWDSGCDAQLPNPESDKRQLFDVWNTHTKDCVVCRDALTNINRFKVLSYVGALVCLLIGIIIDARTVAFRMTTTVEMNISPFTVTPSTEFWVAIVGAIVLGTIGYLLQKFSQLFYVYEFEHSRNN
ncbi:Rieske 2Fe-2S domain-containing protein [Dapis sp. BLCC M126]|uniref:aromatic ring-hydroxylating dioxygenase subunit alpha n=1 Tax=Dapis sp. BLCC M126 TaxID=3400189 RepID=UPI003CF60657